jgi:cysteinyl-tRNA synthetase
MGLRLYNTLTRKLEDFVPQNKVVGIYTCGLTVQGPPHLGHMRAYINRDVLLRWLEHSGYQVKSVENFTDIDDKVIAKQEELGKDWRIIGLENITKYLNAVDRLNIKRADVYPRASQHIAEIIELVQTLIDKGFAYEKGGDVYFKVRAYHDYGKLSHKSIDDLISGARIAPTEHKEDPLDFALWKAAKPGEPYWFSPWGKGRPGWHIECSAMSMKHLGETFDIHTGGEDLIFPHHENEIAQSSAATGKPFARYWFHNGWVTLSGEKMAKSTGHFFLIEDLLQEYNPNVIRMYLLKTNYRTQIDFQKERLEEAKAAYARVQTFINGVEELKSPDKPMMMDEFKAAMDDDLNTSKALGIIFEMVKLGYEEKDEEKAMFIAASAQEYLSILGFRKDRPQQPFLDIMHAFRTIKNKLSEENKTQLFEEGKNSLWDQICTMESEDKIVSVIIHTLLDIRNELRKQKEYGLADFIRDQLSDAHIQVQDKDLKTSTYRLEIV